METCQFCNARRTAVDILLKVGVAYVCDRCVAALDEAVREERAHRKVVAKAAAKADNTHVLEKVAEDLRKENTRLKSLLNDVSTIARDLAEATTGRPSAPEEETSTDDDGPAMIDTAQVDPVRISVNWHET